MLFVGALVGQEARENCPICLDTRELQCVRCDPTLERAVSFCSVSAECRRCGGALAVPCLSCEGDTRVAQLEGTRQQIQAWHERSCSALSMALWGEVGKVRLKMFCSTAHIDLFFSPGRIVSTRDGDVHAQMHTFADRLERARERFLQVTGLSAADFPVQTRRTASRGLLASDTGQGSPRARVFVLEDEVEFRRVSAGVTGIAHQGLGVKRLGGQMVYVVRHDPKHLRRDRDLHRNLVHNLVHLLLSNVEPSGWLGQERGGWIDAGLAHYFESDLVDGTCVNFCFLERAQPPVSFRNGDWRKAARDLSVEGRLPSIGDLVGQDTSSLDFAEHVASFALVAYLIEGRGQDGPRIADLIRAMKRGAAGDEACSTVYGLDLEALENRLGAWLQSKEVR